MSAIKSKYSLRGRFNFEDLYNAFLGLEQREQTILVIVSVVVFILLLVLPISCTSSKLGALRQEYSKTRKGTESLASKLRDYQSSKMTLEALKKKLNSSGGDSLTTILESLANDEGIGQNIDKLHPVNLETTDFYDELGVDAILSKVSLDQIVSYLYKIENDSRLPMRIKKLQMKPSYQNRQLLSVTFEVSTLKLKGEGK